MTISGFSVSAGDALPGAIDLGSNGSNMVCCSLVCRLFPAIAGEGGLSGGVPKLGGLFPNESCKAAARADWPGPSEEPPAPGPARGVLLSASDRLGALYGTCGEDARRAMDVVRDADSANGDALLRASAADEPGIGRGLEGDEACECLCPDIVKGVQRGIQVSTIMI